MKGGAARVKPGPGQESVWDYPRPPAVVPSTERIRVVFGGEVIADSTSTVRVLETSHPPVYYIPRKDIREEFFSPSPTRSTFCEWKGSATYFDLHVSGKSQKRAAWSYEAPSASRFESITGYIAFYPALMDACYINEEKVQSQAGDFYGGWITRKIVGPFKGEPGTMFW